MPALDADLEPEFEAWLQHLVPDLYEQVQGASAEEIETLAAIAGYPLPSFYRWFLARMGRSLGSLAYPKHDFAAQRVIDYHRRGVLRPNSKFFVIAYNDDDLLPRHIAYQYGCMTERDGRAVYTDSTNTYGNYHSLKEMVSSDFLLSEGIWRNPHCVYAVFTDEGTEDVPALLDPAMQALGFVSPFETSRHCRLYQRGPAAMICCADADEEDGLACMSFSLGASSLGEIRSMLSQICMTSGLELSNAEWDPARPRRRE